MADKAFVDGSYPHSAPVYGFGQPDPSGLGSSDPKMSEQDYMFWQQFYQDVLPPGTGPVQPTQGPLGGPERLSPTPQPSGTRPMSPEVRPTGIPSVPGRAPTTRSVTTIPVTRQVAPIPPPSRPHWSQSWLANATRAQMAANNLAKMPPAQITIRGGNQQQPGPVASSRPGVAPIPPPPATWTGTNTGQQYQVGRTYNQAGYLFQMTPNGPVQVGRANPSLTPAQTYAAASNYDHTPNGQDWASGLPGGADGGPSPMYGPHY